MLGFTILETDLWLLGLLVRIENTPVIFIHWIRTDEISSSKQGTLTIVVQASRREMVQNEVDHGR